MKTKILILLGITAATVALAAEPEVPYPAGYRDWHHVKSMVIEEGHPLYGAFGGIHHLYANDKAQKLITKLLFATASVVALVFLALGRREAAIVGSAVMTFLAVLFGTPVGILAGTYMAEYGRYDRLTSVVRFINDILLSAPSIVIGLFVYEVMVVPMGHFSALAGSVALAVLVLPVVVRTTEDMLLLVPNTLREAAAALGTPRSVIIAKVCYRAAQTGMLTGVLLAIARISGETAPLLFTALNNQFWSTNLNAPMSNLPVVIFQFALSPYADWQKLAWAGALIITLTVLALSIVARTLAASRKQS